MNDKHYRDAMNHLSFSDDLESRTIAALQSASAKNAQEEKVMKNQSSKEENKNTTRRQGDAPRGLWARRHLLFGGGAALVAACLMLVIVPAVRQGELTLERPSVAVTGDAPTSAPTQTGQSADGQDTAVEETLGGIMTMTMEMPDDDARYEYNGEELGFLPYPGYDDDDYEYNGEELGFLPVPEYDEDEIMGVLPCTEGDDYDDAYQYEAYEYGIGPEEAYEYEDMGYSAPDFYDKQSNTEEYTTFFENPFHATQTTPFSTFAADVDTASYAKMRATILRGDAVPASSVRIEEMLNYFHYDFATPKAGEPFGVTTEIAPCPWNEDTKLLLVGLQAEKIATEDMPAQNLVFLIDVSGSMYDDNKLPLVKRSFLLLLDQLQPTDTISIVTYASGDRVVLDGVQAGAKTIIADALESLEADGGTYGEAGIETAYALAQKHFVEGGNNRIILATDGDLNIGVSDTGSLTALVEEKREGGVFLSVLGYGMGNYKDDKLEALADNGNGNYAYIDTIYEARKALVEEMGGTFLTVAKDVKLQLEFNPAHVKGYRLIGYEDRVMAAEDFANDKKDGGEVGSGHSVVALYEIVPSDSPMDVGTVESRYQQNVTAQKGDEWLTLAIRCKTPDGEESKLYEYPVSAAQEKAPSDNMRFASAVAECGMLLAQSDYKGTASYDAVLKRLRGIPGVSADVYKTEFQYMVTLLLREAGE